MPFAHPDRPSNEELLAIYNQVGSRVDLTAEELGKPRRTVSAWLKEARLAEQSIVGGMQLVGASINATGGVSRRYKPVAEPPVIPARTDGYKPPKLRKPKKRAEEVWGIFSDHHAPYHHKTLHSKALDWLADHEPQYGIINGDLFDFPDVSKYDDDDEFNATVQDCLDAGWRLLCDYRHASPTTRFKLKRGNHEERLYKYVRAKAPLVWNVKPVGSDKPWHSLDNLLRLDELQIELDDRPYPHGDEVIAGKVLVEHGDYVSKKAGASISKFLDEADHSGVQGHIHRQGLIRRTKWDIHKKPVDHLGMEVGCMCERRLGYTKRADWQNGFGAVTVWKDGLFSAELATYVKDTLIYRNTRY